jgi:hypothetical protein
MREVFMSRVVEIPVPDNSSLFCQLKKTDFCDAYQVSLSKPQLSVHDAYIAVFRDPPSWVNTLMSVRGVIATVFGLKHEASGGFLDDNYQVGQRIGLFTVQSITTNELIVGDNDTHLDFRISVLKSSIQGIETITVSTAVEIHNTVGRLYMLLVKPFHRFIAKLMLQRAANAGRL